MYNVYTKTQVFSSWDWVDWLKIIPKRILFNWSLLFFLVFFWHRLGGPPDMEDRNLNLAIPSSIIFSICQLYVCLPYAAVGHIALMKTVNWK